MRFVPLSSLCMYLVVFLFFPCSFVQAGDTVELNWAVLRDTEKGLQSLEFTTVPTVAKGSTLQLYLHPGEHTHTYVFLLDSSNHVIPIFPSTFAYYDDNPPGKEIRIPAGQDRFTIVPPPGEERFYLLASYNRLDELEQYLEECLVKPDDANVQARLYREIRMLRRKHSKLSQFTEKGMPVSGTTRQLNNTRGINKRDDFQITHVTADGFYSRILRLNHD